MKKTNDIPTSDKPSAGGRKTARGPVSQPNERSNRSSAPSSDRKRGRSATGSSAGSVSVERSSADRRESKRQQGLQLELFATDADGRLAAEAMEGMERPVRRQAAVRPSQKPGEASDASRSSRPSQKPGEVSDASCSSKGTKKKGTRPSRGGGHASKASRSEGKDSKPMPAWLRYLLMLVIAVVFSGAFYYFFVRPYAYRWKPCYGLKAYGICMPYGYQVHGIDISHHQGAIDWNHLQQTRQGPFPIHFIFLKASEGGDYSDPTFVANFDSARNHGFIRGAYHFYNPKTDPLRQADFFIRSVKLEPGDLPPVLDIEKRAKDEAELRRDLKIWLDRIEQHYGVKPILYTSYKYKTRYLNDSVFNSYPYWIAHYYVDSVEYQGAWKFWQHTDVGSLPGVEEQVDLNIFNGSLEELRRMLLPEMKEDSVRIGGEALPSTQGAGADGLQPSNVQKPG